MGSSGTPGAYRLETYEMSSITGVRTIRAERLSILVPPLTTLGLGLWGIGSPGPWADEMVTIDAVQYPLHHLWELPLMPYYVAVWTWSFMGTLDDIVWLRLFSVLSMAAAAAFVALTARRLAGPKAAIFAGLIFAMAPFVQRYAQEARVYALATALAALATWIFVLATQQSSRRLWVGYALSLAAATIFFPLSLAVVPAHGLILLLNKAGREALRSWVFACFSLIPFVAIQIWMSTQYGFMHDIFDKPGVDALIGSPGIILGPVFGVAVIALGFMSQVGMRWVLGTALGVASIAVVSWISTSWWLERSFKPLTVLLVIAAGISVAQIRWRQVLALLVLFGLVAFPDLVGQRQHDARGEDVREMAAIMDAEGQIGDTVPEFPDPIVWWTVEHLLKDWDRFSKSEGPVEGRYWEIQPEPTCELFREWPVSGARQLRLCLNN